MIGRNEHQIDQLRTTIASSSRTMIDTRRMILEDIRKGRRTESLSGQMAAAIVNKVGAQIELNQLRAEEVKPIVDVFNQIAQGRQFGLQLLEILSPGSSRVFTEPSERPKRQSVIEAGQDGPMGGGHA